jgi:hypothetical protein
MTTSDHYAIRNARSMEAFAEGGATIRIGEWRAWRNACTEEGRMIPPAEFKAPSPRRASPAEATTPRA